jgi:hypothetical protein
VSLAGHARNGNSDPDFNMNFANDFQLGDFQIYTLFEWRQGQSVVNLTELLYDGAFNSADFGDPNDFFNASSDFSTESCRPDCSGAERLAGFVNGWALPYTQRASFFKAREIALSYTLPESVTSRIFNGFFDQIRLRASGRNLFTVTNYRGLDPEVSNFGTQQVGRSIDVAPFPPSRSFWFGFDLRL